MKIKAQVIEGVQIGAKFGIATANLELTSLPKIAEGVYLAAVRFEEQTYDALFHFGPRKTFGGDFSAEVHILDFNQEIYGETLTLEIVKKLRDVKAFKNADLLFTQIETDILVARKYFMRQRIRAQWATLSLHDQAVLSERAVHHISAKAEFLEAKRVFVYAPQMGKEIGFVAALMSAYPHKTYAFPKIKALELEFYSVPNYTQLVRGAFGLLEPSVTHTVISPQSRDVILVPSVAADNKGFRLGRGGGFYDRYLSSIPRDVKRIAVLPWFSLVKTVPTEKHDQSLDEVIVCAL